MCWIVWLSPQSQRGDVCLPHLWRVYAHLPCCVLILLSVDHVLHGKSKPSGGSVMHGSAVFTKAVHSVIHASVMLKLFSIDITAVFVGGLLDISWVWPAVSRCLCISRLAFAVNFLNAWTRAFSRRSCGGGMWLKTGRHWVGIDLITPAIILMVLLSCANKT